MCVWGRVSRSYKCSVGSRKSVNKSVSQSVESDLFVYIYQYVYQYMTNAHPDDERGPEDGADLGARNDEPVRLLGACGGVLGVGV